MRILLTVQYLGTNYHGWQIQPGKVTVQQVLDDAIYQALGERCETFASGRTDAGVHAWGQRVHFDTKTKIAPSKIAYAINRYLPSDIAILDSVCVPDDFNARYNVIKKTYEYCFYASITPQPLLDITHARVRTDFDYDRASSACQYFVGTHDFVGFSSAGRQTMTTVRTIYDIVLSRVDDNVYKLTITGNGFLYNMVRIIAGTLIEVGYGQILPTDLPDIIASKDRSRAGRTAQACGLALKKVYYK